MDYFHSAMPTDFSPQPTVLQIVELWQAIVTNYTNGVSDVEMFNSVYDAAQSVCYDEFCAAIGFQGNADLAGNGVMIAYGIEAGLVSLFLVAMVMDQLRQRRSPRVSAAEPKVPDTSPTARILDAFRGGITNFWSSAAVVSLAMLVISLRMTARAKVHLESAITAWRSGSAVSAYDTQLATVASSFSIFPVFILSLLIENRRRRRWLKYFVQSILYALVLAQIHIGTKLTALSVASTLSSLGRACNPSAVDKMFRKYGSPVFYILIALPASLVIISAATVLRSRLQRGSQPPTLTSHRLTVHFSQWYITSLKVFVCVACFTLMWASFALLVFMRNTIVATAGHDDPALEWGFGQLLALATWIPVFVEWFYTLIFGLRTGLEGRIPEDYAIVYTGIAEADQTLEDNNYQSNHGLLQTHVDSQEEKST